jgi:hypothetical protein
MNKTELLPAYYYKIIACIDTSKNEDQLRSCERMVKNFSNAPCKTDLKEHLDFQTKKVFANQLIDKCWLLCEDTLSIVENI